MQKIILVISIMLFSGVSQAKVAEMSFDEMAKQSDLIIEGYVVNQEKIPFKSDGDFSYSQLSTFHVVKALKGNMSQAEDIKIYSGMDFICDVSSLELKQRYLLFLKKYNDGYMDTHYGRGKFIISEHDGGKWVFDWTKRKSSLGEDYYHFIKKIFSALQVKPHVRVLNKKDCENQLGVWSRYGMLQLDQCNLPTGDKGKVCRDSDECEGTCITELTDEQKKVLIETDEILTLDGKCSEWTLNYGCHPFVDQGKVNDILCVD